MDFPSLYSSNSPPQQFGTLAPVSPQASMGSDGRRSTQSTPKRRRLASSDNFSYDQGPTFAVPDETFAPWSPVEELHEYRHRQPHQPHLPQHPPQPFEAQWGMYSSTWVPDASEPFNPAMIPSHAPGPRQPRSLVETFGIRPQGGIPQQPRFPQHPHELFYGGDRTRHTIPDHALMHASHEMTSIPIPIRPPTQLVFRKGAIVLTLCRATQETIDEIAEHKRECPACQLDFEPDNVLAIIECCNTAMHAVCFSAWVNSNNGPGQTRTKSCMKCRKPIDATAKMNSIIPPVTGQSWDQASDFNAPAQITVNNPIKIDVSMGPEPKVRHHYQHRRDARAYRHRPPPVPECDIFEECLDEYRALTRSQAQERERMAQLVVSAHRAWGSAFDREGQAASAASDAKITLDTGGRMTQQEVDGLVRRAREAKEVQEENREEWRTLEMQLKRLDSRQHQAQVEFIRRMHQRRATATASAGTDDSVEALPQGHHEQIIIN
jgi:hypothetical protein